MRRFKRIAAAILALMMIICSVSCGNENVSTDGTDASDTSADVPENARSIALRAFEEKSEALNSKTDRRSDVTVKLDKKTGDASYSEEYEYSYEYMGIGTEDFIAQVNTKAVLEKTVIKSTETFSDGAATYEIDGDSMYYITEMAAEDYMEHHIPAVIFDPELYETVEYDSEEGTFLFSDANGIESWAAPDHAKVITAKGSITLSEGEISVMSYEAEFVQGPVAVKASYEVKVGAGTLNNDTLAKPASEKKVLCDDIEIPMAVRYAYDMLGAGFGTNGKRSDYIYSYASGTEMTSSFEFANRGKGADAVAKVTENSVVRSAQGGSVSSESELIYKNGSATYSEDGSEPAPSDVTLEAVVSLINAYNGYNLTDRRDMNNISSEHLPDYLIVNFALPTDYGNLVEDTVSDSLFGDKDYLDRYASSYSTNKLEAYLCIDKDTGFVTGSGVEYVGLHLISGQQCPLIYTSNSVCRMADPAAYTAVTGEPVPAEEPEDKPTPAFYIVTSPEGKKMYLLGTIHVGDAKMSYLPKEITDALASSDALAIEINNDTLEQRVMENDEIRAAYSEGMTYQDGSSNKTKLSAELYASLRRIAKVFGDTVYAELYYPSVIAARYELELLGSSGSLAQSMGAENILKKIANENGVEIIEVEEIIGRLKLDSRYSAITQMYLLDAAASVTRAELMDETAELYALWCEGEEEKLREAIKEDAPAEDAEDEEKYAYAEYERILRTERDEQMIAKAKEYLASDKTVFFAVGAAHVLGDGGLVDSLRGSGYTVEKVEYK